MRESTIEKHLVAKVKAMGGMAYKFTSRAARQACGVGHSYGEFEMTDRDDITRMAREAGLYLDGENTQQPLYVLNPEELERFAALVAAAEREACAELCEQMDHDGVMIAADCAEAIRARGNQ